LLYLSAIILAFFLAFVLITKKRKSTADYTLAAWLGIIGFHLFTFYLGFTGHQAEYPTLAVIGIALPLAQGPFLYLYTRYQTSLIRFHAKHLLHFLPVVLTWVLFYRFWPMSFAEKVRVFEQKGAGFETEIFIHRISLNVSGVVYVMVSLVALMKYRKNMVQQFSNTEKINFNWLLYMIFWMIAIWTTVLFIQEDNLIFGAAALFVLWLGYFGIKQVQIFNQHTVQPPLGVIPQAGIPTIETGTSDIPEPGIPETATTDENSTSAKYQKSSLSEEEAASIHERLMLLMEEEKPFTNPDLTLNELAKSLEVHPNYLSQVINSKENKSFYDLINERRVEEFIKLTEEPGTEQFTLLSMAYDCGFNSKASFNRNFKKYTGLTPSDYLKRQPAEQV
jgi:AraC-like DNA-binding protein